MPTTIVYPHPDYPTLRSALEEAQRVELKSSVILGGRLNLAGLTGRVLVAASGLEGRPSIEYQDGLGSMLINGSASGLLIQGVDIVHQANNPGGPENGTFGLFPTGDSGPGHVQDLALKDVVILGGPSNVAGLQANSLGRLSYAGVALEDVEVGPSTDLPLGAYSKLGPSGISFFYPLRDSAEIDLNYITVRDVEQWGNSYGIKNETITDGNGIILETTHGHVVKMKIAHALVERCGGNAFNFFEADNADIDISDSSASDVGYFARMNVPVANKTAPLPRPTENGAAGGIQHWKAGGARITLRRNSWERKGRGGDKVDEGGDASVQNISGTVLGYDSWGRMGAPGTGTPPQEPIGRRLTVIDPPPVEPPAADPLVGQVAVSFEPDRVLPISVTSLEDPDGLVGEPYVVDLRTLTEPVDAEANYELIEPVPNGATLEGSVLTIESDLVGRVVVNFRAS